MKTLITEFIRRDGVVQAPGAREEDTDGGFYLNHNAPKQVIEIMRKRDWSP